MMSDAQRRNIHTHGEWLDEIAKAAAAQAQVLNSGGPGDRYGGMEERVAKLETHFEYVRRDLDEIRADQKVVLAKLDEVAVGQVQGRAHTAGKVTVITTGIAVVAVILGVLAYGGDRFSQGMEVDAASKSAAQAVAAP